MAFKIIVNLVVNITYILVPALVCFKILKSISCIDSIGEAFCIALLLLTVISILSYLLIQFTTNNLVRYIVIILSASCSFFTVVALTPNNPCVVPVVFMTFLAPLLLGSFICFLASFILLVYKINKPASKEKTAKSSVTKRVAKRVAKILFRNKVNILVNIAYIFVPILICFKIIKSIERITSAYDMFFTALMPAAITAILSYILIKFTTSKLVRFIVVILSASGSIYTIIALTPNNDCIAPVIFTYFLPPLCLVYFVCLLNSLMLLFKPANKEIKKVVENEN